MFLCLLTSMLSSAIESRKQLDSWGLHVPALKRVGDAWVNQRSDIKSYVYDEDWPLLPFSCSHYFYLNAIVASFVARASIMWRRRRSTRRERISESLCRWSDRRVRRRRFESTPSQFEASLRRFQWSRDSNRAEKRERRRNEWPESFSSDSRPFCIPIDCRLDFLESSCASFRASFDASSETIREFSFMAPSVFLQKPKEKRWLLFRRSLESVFKYPKYVIPTFTVAFELDFDSSSSISTIRPRKRPNRMKFDHAVPSKNRLQLFDVKYGLQTTS